MTTGHPDLETLAQLADATLGETGAAAVRAHLATCRSCMAAYADAVRYRAAYLATPQVFAPSGRDASALASATVDRTRLAPRRAARTGTLLGAAALAAVAVIAVLLRPPASLRERVDLPPGVSAATRASSSRGLVLPGGADAAAAAQPEFRSGTATRSPQLQRESDSLYAAYENGPRTTAAAVRLVAALLATGEFDAARDYAREGLRRDPNSLPLRVLAADVQYRTNDLAGAEDLLRDALQRSPADPMAALDLAMVLRQRGSEAEARELLERVAHSGPASLAARARAELNAPL